MITDDEPHKTVSETLREIGQLMDLSLAQDVVIEFSIGAELCTRWPLPPLPPLPAATPSVDLGHLDEGVTTVDLLEWIQAATGHYERPD